MAGTVCSAVTAQAFFTLQEIRCIWKKFSFFAADIHHTKWKTLPLHRKWEIDHHMFASKFSFWVLNDSAKIIEVWPLYTFSFWNISGCTPVDQVLAKFRDPLHRMYIATRQKNGYFTLWYSKHILSHCEGSQKCIFNAFNASAIPLSDRFVTEQQRQ